ncbi:MAG TPA: NosD domain-containing protein [Candidatus Methanoperedens sp.]
MILRKIVLILFVMLFSLGFADGATLKVGTGQTYATIQSAVDAANTGDVISVSEGVYGENLVIKKDGISIIGMNREKTVIDGRKTGTAVKIDQANNVKISGFTIENSGGSGKEDAGLTVFTGKKNTITNNIFLNNIAGISIYSSSNSNVISGNDIRSSANNGIFLFSATENEIYDNNIRDNKFGIYADSSRTNKIYSNNFINNNNQAYDNSGLNSWDDGKSGNYWSDSKGSGAYTILGGSSKDNYPRSSEVTIKYDNAATPAGQKTALKEEGKSTPGFSGIAVMVLIIAMGILRKI